MDKIKLSADHIYYFEKDNTDWSVLGDDQLVAIINENPDDITTRFYILENKLIKNSAHIKNMLSNYALIKDQTFRTIIRAYGKELDENLVIHSFLERCEALYRNCPSPYNGYYYELNDILFIRTSCELSFINDQMLLERQRECEKYEAASHRSGDNNGGRH